MLLRYNRIHYRRSVLHLVAPKFGPGREKLSGLPTSASPSCALIRLYRRRCTGRFTFRPDDRFADIAEPISCWCGCESSTGDMEPLYGAVVVLDVSFTRFRLSP